MAEIIFETDIEKYRGEVMGIFNYYIENSFAAYPERKLPDKLFDMFLEIAKKYPVYVIKIKDTDQVAGFCLLRSYNPFAAFNETAEISYFIDKDYVGQGIGEQALQKLESDAKRLNIRTILADISSKNIGSIKFHQKHGFRECGRFKNIGKKFGEYFDVVWMQKNIG